MRKFGLARSVALLLAALMLLGSMSMPAFAAEDEKTASTSTTRSLAELKEILNAITYQEYMAKNAEVPNATKNVVIDAHKYTSASEDAVVEVCENIGGYNGKALFVSDTGSVTWEVEIPENGKYSIVIEYYPIDDYTTKDGKNFIGKSASIERMLLINDKVLFGEARTLSLSKVWENVYFTDTTGSTPWTEESGAEPVFRQDINGNDIRPSAVQKPMWQTFTVKDSTGYYDGGLLFALEKGKNTVTLEAVREPVVIKSISFVPPAENTSTTLEEYKANAGSGSSAGATVVKIEAEKPVTISDNAIFPINDRTSAVTSPQTSDAQLLNTIGKTQSYKTVGQWVTYNFTVDKSGYYTIASRFKQNAVQGLFTSRIVMINGEVLYDECYNVRFDYGKKWVLENFNDGEKDLVFYFEAGKEYELKLEVGLGDMSEIVREVEESLNLVNSAYLEVIKLTGADPDEYRDYNFSRIMPDVLKTFIRESRRLTSISEHLVELCGTKGSQTATLDRIAYLLETMGADESKVAGSLKTLKSYIGTLGTWLNDARSQPVQFDYFLIVPEGEELGKANENFFSAIWYEIKLFVASFFTDYSNIGSTTEVNEEDSVEVWLSSGRDQSLVVRNMVDSMFIPQSGISVEVKLVAGGTLLPSVLSGQGPDTFIGMGAADVINYAIRSAVLPVNQREGYEEIMTEFTEAARVPLTLYDYNSETETATETVYGLPESMGFSMMYYRKDIMADLGLEIPKTWDELLSCVTVLQANNMNVGLQRDYDLFLYQMGGNRYADHGMRSGLDSNVALESFEYYCNFYTSHSFPVTYDAANRFRTGEMPIVITNYAAMYNTLTVFATEIKGLWDFTVLPGTLQDDGSINNDAVAAISGLVMMNGCDNEDDAWEFMKWFVGHEAQSAYCNQLITTIGPAAKHATANKQALRDMAWTSGELEVLLDQFDDVCIIEQHPGGYIFDRYINFAFYSAYNDGKDPVEELRSYIHIINSELTRKREEFDMEILETGETLADRAN